ncbi:hypothetical protein EBB07_29545 [Paenibacillaceae bacterium]|nr:hypothetical protein EBB07_29545 [Paenibacillaceae bacterium]
MANLKLNQLKNKVDKKYNGKKRIDLGDNFKIDIDTVFKPSKKNEVLHEYASLFQEMLKKKTVYSDSNLLTVITALIIKKFTSLETDAKSYEEVIEMMEILLDGGYLNKIVEALMGDEMTALIEEFGKVNEEITNHIYKAAEELEEEANTLKIDAESVVNTEVIDDEQIV